MNVHTRSVGGSLTHYGHVWIKMGASQRAGFDVGDAAEGAGVGVEGRGEEVASVAPGMELGDRREERIARVQR